MQVRYSMWLKTTKTQADISFAHKWKRFTTPRARCAVHLYLGDLLRQRLWGYARFLDQHNDLRLENQTVGVCKRTLEAAQAPGGISKLSWTWGARYPQPYLGVLAIRTWSAVISGTRWGRRRSTFLPGVTIQRPLPLRARDSGRRFPGAYLTKEYMNNLTAGDLIWDQVVSWRHQAWEFGGGDAGRCQDIGKTNNGSPGRVNQLATPRVYLAEEGERNAQERSFGRRGARASGGMASALFRGHTDRRHAACWQLLPLHGRALPTDGKSALHAISAGAMVLLRSQAPDRSSLVSFGMVNDEIGRNHLTQNGTGVVVSLFIQASFAWLK